MVEPILPLKLQSLLICAKATITREVIQKTYTDLKPQYSVCKNVLLKNKGGSPASERGLRHTF